MIVTKNDLHRLIDQSDNTISEKAEMDRMVSVETLFDIGKSEQGVMVTLKTNKQTFTLKGISMSQFYNNRKNL